MMVPDRPGILLPHAYRWVVVTLSLLALLVLALAASKVSADGEATLGVRAATRHGSLVLSWVQPGGVGWALGLRPGAQILSVPGLPPRVDPTPAAVAAASAIVARTPAGRRVSAAIPARIAQAESAKRQLSFIALSVCFVLVGSIIYLLIADVAVGLILFTSSLCAASALLAAIATPFGTPWAFVTEHVSVIGFGASVFLLFLVFPVNRLSLGWGRWLAGAWLVGTLTLIGIYAWVVAEASPAFEWLETLGFGVLAVDFVGAAILASFALRRTSELQRETQLALGLVVLGMLAGLAPFYLLALIPHLLGMSYILAPTNAILGAALMPLSLGAAALSRQFPGVTILIRRSLIAVAVWTGLVGLYTMSFHVLARLIGLDQLAFLLPITALTVALIGATFAPAQVALRRAVERALFHDVYDYAEALRRLSQEIAGLTTIEAIARHVVKSLATMLALRWATITVMAPGLADLQYSWGRDEHQDAATEMAFPKLSVPLAAEGNVLGHLAIGPKRHDAELLPEDTDLITTLAPLVGTSLRNVLLNDSLERQVAALAARERELAALTIRLMQAQEDERRRIALDLHDDPLQRAILLVRDMSGLSECGGPAHCEQLQRDAEEIATSLQAICMGLRPPMLDDLGLAAALNWLTRDLSARSELEVDLNIEDGPLPEFERLDANLESVLYRVAQEALTNCLKHAQANKVWVVLRRDQHAVILEVADDGSGVIDASHDKPPGLRLGLVGMRERVRPWGGSVAVAGHRTGGTLVCVRVPLPLPIDGHSERERVSVSEGSDE